MNPILEVVTISEAVQLWQRNNVSIRRAIGTGRRPLMARKSPDSPMGIWLISVESLINRWGQPKKNVEL